MQPQLKPALLFVLSSVIIFAFNSSKHSFVLRRVCLCLACALAGDPAASAKDRFDRGKMMI